MKHIVIQRKAVIKVTVSYMVFCWGVFPFTGEGKV